VPAELHFLRPAWFLALVPLALLLWHLARRAGAAEAWRGQIDAHLLPHLLVGGGRPRRWRLALLGLAWLLAVTALAGPVWERQPAPAHRSAVARVILLDLSPTMLAGDVAPSRLVRARLEVLDLLRAGADGQTALIAFGAEPFLVAPLTTDTATIAAQVPSLAPDLLPVDGASHTDLALQAAGELLAGVAGRPGEVLLVNDGLPQPASAFAAAQRLAGDGHRLSILLVAPPPGGDGLATAEHGSADGASPDRDALARLAEIGGGRLVTLTADGADTRALLADPQGARDAADDEAPLSADRWREEGPWLLLLLVPLAALGFRRGWLAPVLAVVFLVPSGAPQAGVWQDLWWRPDQQAARALAEGRAAEAAERFADPAWRAAARYRAGDYAGAAEDLAGLGGAVADYNRGNALARAGRLAEALAAYDRALVAAPGLADAAHNRELVRRLLAQQGPQGQVDSGDGRRTGAPPRGPADSDPAGGEGSESEGEEAAPAPSSPQGGAETEGPGQSESAAPPGAGSRSAAAGTGDATDGDADDDRGRRSAAGGAAGAQAEPFGASGKAPEGSADDGDGALESGGPPPDNAGDPSPDAAAGDARPLDQPAPQPSGGGDAADLRPGDEPGLADLLAPQDASVGGPTGGVGGLADDPRQSEAQQAFEQMLRRVPDDPAGLLRQRFLLEHLRREGRL
jgi:Ca-activated chloride channel family protein